MAENCAPGVSPSVMEKLVAAESGFEPYAIGVNGQGQRSYTAGSVEEAAQLAQRLISEGASIDMGLGQINSANLEWLGLTPDTVFDACRNLGAAQTVLREGYVRARERGVEKGTALQQALSSYNTGSLTRGFANGYVDRVLGGGHGTIPVAAAARPAAPRGQADPPEGWDVFATSNGSGAHVFQ
ncbi:lytic transglycosylase domain-containing protein [Salipiger pacificus]|uniref:Lytic transglycosylase domain-containing protein n=1 Tax=Salipiger mangrovisoli TaxID=2865933 RepID=A0ABR9X8K5_9RHOB|nr:lytic transglycosylase domain-containing protein [Salipiger mangrovisoli]